MRTLARLLALAAVLVAAVGCGLPDDRRPRVVAGDDAPLDLSPSTTVATDDTEGGDVVSVFFIDRETGVLAPVVRSVPSVTPQTAIDQLLAGPRPDEAESLVTAIPLGTVQLASSLEGGTLTVDLGPPGEGGIQSVQGQAQLQAFAQLVRTATGVSGVRDVLFRVAGEPIDAATDAGASSAPVSRADYASLAPAGG